MVECFRGENMAGGPDRAFARREDSCRCCRVAAGQWRLPPLEDRAVAAGEPAAQVGGVTSCEHVRCAVLHFFCDLVVRVVAWGPGCLLGLNLCC